MYSEKGLGDNVTRGLERDSTLCCVVTLLTRAIVKASPPLGAIIPLIVGENNSGVTALFLSTNNDEGVISD